jgi:hypothetical protein
MTTHQMDDLLALASCTDERRFATAAIDFLGGRLLRRAPDELAWGVGPERLALF